MDTCFLCKSEKRDEIKYGEFMTRGDISVHYFCLLLTSNLMQKGKDTEGFLGFLVNDIEAEAERVAAAMCCYCKKPSANISCCATKCRKTFHLTCGLEHNAENQFIGTFKSYCDRHVPGKKKIRAPAGKETCCICYDDLIGAAGKFNCVTMLQAPCCKNGWFHKLCLAEFAKTAGYFFKCPLCNDNKDFRRRLVYKGIFIPDRDAAWELEPNAFAELLERPEECSAVTCIAKNGRTSHTNRNKLIICATCGSVAIHRLCMTIQTDYFYCDECTPVIATQHSASTINISPSQQNESDDEEVDVCGDDDPPPRPLTSNQSQETDDDDEGTVQPKRRNHKNIFDDDLSSDIDDSVHLPGRRKNLRRLPSSDNDSPMPHNISIRQNRYSSRDRDSFFDSGAETDRSESNMYKTGYKTPARTLNSAESSNNQRSNPVFTGFRTRRGRCVPLKDSPNESYSMALRTRRQSVCSGSSLTTVSTQDIPTRRKSTTGDVRTSARRSHVIGKSKNVLSTVGELSSSSTVQPSVEMKSAENRNVNASPNNTPVAHRTRRRRSLCAIIPPVLQESIFSPRRSRTMSEDPSKISPAVQRTRSRSLALSNLESTPLLSGRKSISTESLVATPKTKRSRSNSASSNYGIKNKKVKIVASDDENDCHELNVIKKRPMSRDRSPLTSNLRGLYAFLTPAYVKKDAPNDSGHLVPNDTSTPDYSKLFNKNKPNIQQKKAPETVKAPIAAPQLSPETDSPTANKSNLTQDTLLQSYNMFMGTSPDSSKPSKLAKPKHRRSHTFSAHNLPSNQTKIESFFKRV